jgi:hypothetical protein
MQKELKQFGYPFNAIDHMREIWTLKEVRRLLDRNETLTSVYASSPDWVNRLNDVLPFWQYGIKPIWFMSPVCTPTQASHLGIKVTSEVFGIYGLDISVTQEEELKKRIEAPVQGVAGPLSLWISSNQVTIHAATYADFIQAIRTAATITGFVTEEIEPNVWLTFVDEKLELHRGENIITKS